MSIHEYLDSLPSALLEFQYLETMLKFYIRDCDKIIQKSVKNSFHYSVREKEIEKMSLRRLIEEFSRRSNRKDIISALRILNKHRNMIAHTAYLVTFEDQKNSEKMEFHTQRIKKVTKLVNECMKQIIRESSKVKNEPIPEDLLKQWDEI